MIEYLIAQNDPNLVIAENRQYDVETYSLYVSGQLVASGTVQKCKRIARMYSHMPRLKWVRDDAEGARRIKAEQKKHGFQVWRSGQN